MYSAYKLNKQGDNICLDILLSQFKPLRFSKSSSNCCFLACIQISQEANKVVWDSHLFKNFPQFIVIHTVKGFGIVNEALDVFLEFSCFFCDPTDADNLISGSSSFSKSRLNIWEFSVHVLLNCLGEYWALLFQHVRWVQLCSSLDILWHCLSLGLEWKLSFSNPSFSVGVTGVPLEKARDQIANICWIIEKARIPEKYLLLLYWLCQSLWLRGSQQTVENS